MADRPEKKPAAPKKSPSWKQLRKWALLVLLGLSLGALSFAGWHTWLVHGKAIKGWVKKHLPHKKHAPKPAPKAEAPAPAPAPVAPKAEPKVEAAPSPMMAPRFAPDKGKVFDVLMDSQFSSGSVEDWTQQAWKAAKNHKRVLVRITSPGGSGFAMLKFLQSMADLKKQTGASLVCYADIMAASAAAITLEAACDERYAVGPATLILFHEVQINGIDARNEAQGDDEMALIHRLNIMVDTLVSSRLGMPLEAYRAKVYGHDWWLSPEEALQIHAIDAVVDPMDAPSAPEPKAEKPAAPAED
jgi:ATP-dependent protease ClpP protease subunit